MALNLISNKEEADYSCTQVDLYTLCHRIVDSYKFYLSFFTNFSTKYTLEYGNIILGLINTASDLPDEDERSAVHEEFRIKLELKAKICLNLSQDLKTHIQNSWVEDFWEVKFQAAGFSKYRISSQENWNEITNMLKTQKKFIQDNLAILTAGGMPPVFQTTFTDAYEVYKPIVGDFIEAENMAKVGTNDKIKANNIAYKEIKNIAEAGKKIFRDDAAKSSLFTISTQLELISGVGSHWRNFEIIAGGSTTAERAVKHSMLENTGETAISFTEGETGSQTGVILQPGESIRLEFSENIITGTNLSPDKKGSFKVRCVKGA